MKAETMAVVDPTRAKEWKHSAGGKLQGSQVWPPPSLEQPEPPDPFDENWQTVKESVFSHEGYDGPVDVLYSREASLTELDRYLLRAVKDQERSLRREQALQQKVCAGFHLTL